MNTEYAITTHWDELVSGYDPIMSSDPAYRNLLTTIMQFVPSNCTDILDIGCGTGALTRLCHLMNRSARVVGIDPAPKMLERARAQVPAPLVEFQEGTASDLQQFEECSFDAVVSNFALHHLSQPEKRCCAAEVFRVLRPGGVFVFGDQHCEIMGDRDDPARVLHTLELLTNKARYYYLNAGMDRMLLQLRLLPRFINFEGEILATPQFWVDAMEEAGFADVQVEVIPPSELLNRVIRGNRPAHAGGACA